MPSRGTRSATVEGYGPNGLLDRVTGHGWRSSRKGQRYFQSIVTEGNAVLYDQPSERFSSQYRITIDTIPGSRNPLVVEGYQSERFPHAFLKGVKFDGVALRALRYQEIDHLVTAYRVICESVRSQGAP